MKPFCPLQLYKGRINATCHLIQHPMYGAGHKYRTLHLPISTTLAEVLDRVSGTFLSCPRESRCFHTGAGVSGMSVS